jgi:hypothetical protein
MYGFDESDANNAHKATNGEVSDPIVKAVIKVADVHATHGLREDFVPLCVLQPEIRLASEDF